jgi:hypothetical protein
MSTIKNSLIALFGLASTGYVALGMHLYAIDRVHTTQGNPHIDLTNHPTFGSTFAPFDYKPK